MNILSKPQIHLYLASASPRRRELLAQVGLHAALLPQHLDESLLPGETPQAYVSRLARAKVTSALQDARYEGTLPIIAADTSVICGAEVFGKPATLADASAMLRQLSGRAHQVLTAVAVANRERCELVVVSTRVHFRQLSDTEISAYWASGEPRDKAGAYAIQGLAAMFVSHIEGSYSGVVGLPLCETLQLLATFGIDSTTLLQGQVA